MYLFLAQTTTINCDLNLIQQITYLTAEIIYCIINCSIWKKAEWADVCFASKPVIIYPYFIIYNININLNINYK